MSLRYLYKGTEFELSEKHSSDGRPYFEVADLISYVEEIIVPSMVNGYEVKGLRFLTDGVFNDRELQDRQFKGVRKLVIPPGMRIYRLSNRNFPDIEEIVFEGEHYDYEFKDGMLFDQYGKRLLLTFKNGMSSREIKIPKTVNILSSGAFKDTTVSRIVFSNPWIEVEGNPFEGSRWYKKHRQSEDTIYVGNMVFRQFNSDELTLDPSISRISPDCFKHNCPEEITTHFIPPSNIIKELNKGGCTKIRITSDCEIPWDVMRGWERLREIRLASHAKYFDKDGVVFDRRNDELIFYPPGRSDEDYTVPDGITSIGAKSFYGHKYLKKVVIGKNVIRIMSAAFMNCSALENVQMHNSKVAELCDAGVFNDGGVFEGCERLRKISLPVTLRHIGSRAFYKTGLTGLIKLKDGIRSIGMYAFSKSSLTKVNLPRTLEIISPGAFADLGISKRLCISVFEGCTYGLFEAVEYPSYGALLEYESVKWQAADITFLDMSGASVYVFRIPQSLNKGYEQIMESAITGCTLNREKYLKCFEGFKDKQEKISIALNIIDENGDLDGICETFIRQSSVEIAETYISENKEDTLVDFLKRGYMTAEDMRTVLRKCNDKGLSLASAYILHYMSSRPNGVDNVLTI
ncbi:MAG: leucine-rich repeat domain-containing protein [Lachnospiraceae bacterium]|nr:leucine-rich repeat domain-containing protein [Lachnospiraceae bacterium]